MFVFVKMWWVDFEETCSVLRSNGDQKSKTLPTAIQRNTDLKKSGYESYESSVLNNLRRLATYMDTAGFELCASWSRDNCITTIPKNLTVGLHT